MKRRKLCPGGSYPVFYRLVTSLLSVSVFLTGVQSQESSVETAENHDVETIGLNGVIWRQNNGIRSRSRLIAEIDNPVNSDEISKGLTSSPLDFTETTIPLNVYERPQFVFTIHGNTTRFNFNVAGPIFGKSPGGDDDDLSADNQARSKYHKSIPVFKISLIVETMHCYASENPKKELSPNLIIQWYKEEKMFSSRFCSYIDNKKNSFQTVFQVVDGISNVSVSAEGHWKSGMNAQLVASIYTDVGESCGNCPSGFFCCGFKDNSCPSKQTSDYFLEHHSNRKYRCIPPNTRNGEPLQCNGHPNCGFFCNADESGENCFRGDRGGPSCFGGSCNMGEVALRIGLLIVSCFLLPPLLILLLCRFHFIRTGCDGCVNFTIRNLSPANVNRRLSRRGLGESDTDFPPVYGDSSEPPAYHVVVDPPPTYEECVQNPQSVKGSAVELPPAFSEDRVYAIPLTLPSTPPWRRDDGGRRVSSPSTSHLSCGIPNQPLQILLPPLHCSRCSVNANCFSGEDRSPPAAPCGSSSGGGVANNAFDAAE